MAADAAALERQAAMNVRRAIQKLRVATPESFDTLEKELANILEEGVSSLGEQLSKLQDEADKGLELARKRIETIQERRKKEEEKSARPRELMKELSAFVEGLEVDTLLLKESFEDTAALSIDSAPDIEKLMEELATSVKSYVEGTNEFTAKNGAEMQTCTAGLPIAQEYAGLIQQVAAKRREADLMIIKAKSVLKEIKTKAQKERLEALKPELQEQLNEVDGFVKSAEQDLLSLERIVFPFSRGKKMTEAEMLANFDEYEGALPTASASIAVALDKSPKMGEDVDEEMKAELEKWLKHEAKRPRLRLGQYQARVSRCKQLVKTARKEIDAVRNEAIAMEMKPQLLIKIKSAMDVSHLEAPLKELEKLVEPFVKAGKQSVDEMLVVADTAAEAISSFRESLSAARAALFPIDESLSDDVKKALTTFLKREVNKPTLHLIKFESRLTKTENLVRKYRADEAKTRHAAIVEELKPQMLEKVENGTGQAVKEFEDMVKTAEGAVEPFARGCKAPPSKFKAIADRAAASVQAAQTAAQTARGDICPIDDSLDDEVKKDLQLFLKPVIRKSELQIGCLERRLRRCSQLVKSFRADILKNLGQRVEKVKTSLRSMVHKIRSAEKLSVEDLFNRFDPSDGFISEAAFQRFFEEAGADAELPPADRTNVFQSCLGEGRSQLNIGDFGSLASTFMKVANATSLMDGISISSSKAVSKLKAGQVVELLEGPMADDENADISRVRVKTVVGDIEGWATVKGNAGTVFLKECNAPPAPKKKA